MNEFVGLFTICNPHQNSTVAKFTLLDALVNGRSTLCHTKMSPHEALAVNPIKQHLKTDIGSLLFVF